MNDTIEEKISGYLSKKIVQNSSYSKEEILKINFGMTILIVNLTKALAIYVIALFLGVLFQTFVAHIAYCILRHFNYGFHFENSLVCSLFGIVCFPVSVGIITSLRLTISAPTMILLSLIFLSLTGWLAPSYTTIIVKQNRNIARLKSVLSTTILLLGTYSPLLTNQSAYIFWGIFISVLLVVINELRGRKEIVQ